jgi:hypothetical protein
MGNNQEKSDMITSARNKVLAEYYGTDKKGNNLRTGY